MRREGQCDIGVLIPPVADAGDLTLADFDAARLAIALLRNHRLAERGDVPLTLLAEEPFVLWPAAEGRGFHVRVIRLCAEAGFVPRVVQEAHQMHGVLSLVAVEAGVSIVPESMSGFRAGEVIYRSIPGAEAGFALSLCCRNQALSPAVSQFFTTAGEGYDTTGLS